MKDEALRAGSFIEQHRSAVVLGHQFPDGDAIGSVLGLAVMLSRRGLDVQASWPEPFELPRRYGFLPGGGMLVNPAEIAGCELVFVLDCAVFGRLEELQEIAGGARVLVNIDHHPDNPLFGTVALVDRNAAATSVIIYRYASDMGLEVDLDAALCLYTGVVTDTGRFQFTNTTAETLRVCAEMVDLGVSPNLVSENVYQSASLSQMRLTAQVLSSAVFEEDLGLVYATMTQDDLSQRGVQMTDTEDLIDFLRALREHEVAALLKEMSDGRVRVSLRSRAGTDVGGVARKLGGGGHRSAAGYTSTKRTFADALLELKEVLAQGGRSTGR